MGLSFRQSLSNVGSFSRSRNTIIYKNPPTNLQCSELVYPWEAFLDSWMCLIERSWVYDGLYLVSIASKVRLLRWKARSCKHANADAHGCTQTHVDARGHANKCRYTQTDVSVSLSVCLSVCLPIYLFIYLSIYLSIYQSIHVPTYLSIHGYIHVHLYIYHFVPCKTQGLKSLVNVPLVSLSYVYCSLLIQC